jgi:hypothetical protein
VGDDQVHHVEAALAVFSMRMYVQTIATVRREHRRDVLGYRAEPAGVLLGWHWREATLGVVFALRGVWRRCDAKGGAGAVEQAEHHVGIATVTAGQPVPRNCPNIAGPRNRLSRSFGNLLFGILAGLGDVGGIGQQHGQFVVAEAEGPKVNLGIPEVSEFGGERRVIPRG